MGGTMNTQASEFPQDEPILETGTTNADEFRDFNDIDITDTAVHHKADYSSVPNETMEHPVNARSAATAERRLYANGPDLVAVANVSEQGTRRYGAFSANAFSGTGGYAGAPVLLLGEDRSRVRVVLSNAHDTDAVVIGGLSDVVNGSGFLLVRGVLFETQTTEPIYACATPASVDAVIPVGVWAEYA
jgi:hypothetical protein